MEFNRVIEEIENGKSYVTPKLDKYESYGSQNIVAIKYTEKKTFETKKVAEISQKFQMPAANSKKKVKELEVRYNKTYKELKSAQYKAWLTMEFNKVGKEIQSGAEK